jgi:hypothetical protein
MNGECYKVAQEEDEQTQTQKAPQEDKAPEKKIN